MAKALTYTGLCTTKGCPWPSSPEWHVPWCGHGLAGEHHHTVNRSQGGHEEPQAFLCHDCHAAVHAGRYTAIVALGMFCLRETGTTGPNLAQVRISGDWENDPSMRFIDLDSGSLLRGLQARKEGKMVPLSQVKAELNNYPDLDAAALTSEDYQAAAGATGIVGTVTEMSWSPPVGAMTFEEWAHVGHTFGRMGRALGFWIGDWVLAGEERFGEMAAQAFDELGLRYQTIANYASVARRLPCTVRHNELSFAHHAEVAYLPPPQQEKWLTRAVSEGLTQPQLRAAIKEEKQPTAVCAHDFALVCRHCGRRPEPVKEEKED